MNDADQDQVKCGPVSDGDWKDQRIASLEAYIKILKEQLAEARKPPAEGPLWDRGS